MNIFANQRQKNIKLVIFGVSRYAKQGFDTVMAKPFLMKFGGGGRVVIWKSISFANCEPMTTIRPTGLEKLSAKLRGQIDVVKSV